MGPILSQSSDQDADDPGARKANFRKRHRRQVGAPRLRLASPSTDHRLSMVPRGRAVFSLRFLPMSASLIGRFGSSSFRRSTNAVLMSLTGARFSSESAPRPLYGAFFVKKFKKGSASFF